MSRIAFFAKYFGYAVGGAERSVLEIAKDLHRQGHQIVVCRQSHPRQWDAASLRINLPGDWEVRDFRLPVEFNRFRFIDYYVNKPSLRRLAHQLDDADELYAYGALAPAVINAFRGRTTYLVRDEYGLGWNLNYYRGLRGLAQGLYHASEAPLRAGWRRELRQAMMRSNLIANSEFISRGMKEITPTKEVQIIPSAIDVKALLAEFEAARRETPKPSAIVMVGDGILKGGDLFRKVAASLPDQSFMMFDRSVPSPRSDGNITYMPWGRSGSVYAHAAMLLVPSRWHEAFPRVVLEARALNIPVVASSRGGIPEALPDPDRLVRDIENITEWRAKILAALATPPNC